MKPGPGGETFPASCFSGSLGAMTRVAIPFLALLLASACSQQSEQPAAEATTAAAPAASTAASVSAAPSVTADGPVSRYTSLKDCTVIETGDGEDWSVSRCDGIGPWTLQVDYGDARDDLRLLQRGESEIKLDLIGHGGGGFNALGDTIEWRGSGEAEKFTPKMLIVRNNVSEDPERSERQTAILFVIDLAKGCVVAKVRPSASQNDEARAIADGPARACLD